ncbi:MAG: hypothetical protein ACI9MC_003153 [Kiritimatiellia bacterium]|jgi:hypothetical protein
MRLYLCLLALACTPDAPTATPNSRRVQVTSEPQADNIDRSAFNAAALELYQPLFWMRDTDNLGTPDADEIEVYLTPDSGPRSDWLDADGFSDRGRTAISDIVALVKHGHKDVRRSKSEANRWTAVLQELQQARVTLVLTDLREASDQDRALIPHLIAAARHVETLHALQRGVEHLSSKATDPASKALFHRNQGPQCEAAKTVGDPSCSAVAELGEVTVGVYPADLQQQKGWCEALAAQDETLLAPFSAVRRDPKGALVAVPYSAMWPEQMQAAAKELQAGAATLGDDEAALRTYLLAAAKAFSDDDWFAADQAWAAMNQDNSRWYVRVGPDETYWDPCNRKAGFHMSLARVNPGSKAWTQRLDPVKADMEQVLAEAAGPPYTAREVGFELPEFIDITLNAGDARNGMGATIGQSLPNWGPVADAGGRTVAMTNLFTDSDSISSRHTAMKSIFCSTSMTAWSDDPKHLLMSTVLHEASHNLGPAHEYRVDGKTDEEAFGGSIASVMEELKAQTAALFLVDWLVQRDLLTEVEAQQAHTADLGWSFSKIADGFTTPTGKRKAYPQLAAVNVGELLDAGALTWEADLLASNGEDIGCIQVHQEKMAPAIADMNRKVLRIKATADRAAAVALLDAHTAPHAPHTAIWDKIAERMGRTKGSSFVYSVRY